MPPIPTATRKLNGHEAALHLGLSKSYLEKLRVSGGGPFFLKIGARVLYDVADLEAWAAKHRRANTSASHLEAA